MHPRQPASPKTPSSAYTFSYASQPDMAIGILGSLTICTTLYVAVSLVVTGMVKYTELKINAPLAEAFRSVGQPGFATLISMAR